MMEKIVVLLPEGKLFDELFAEAIAPSLPNAVRVSPEFSAERQLGGVCGSIEGATLLVADVSGRNPNVLYLVGFAHGIGKKVLLLAQFLEDFPFDRSKHAAIGYGTDREFLRQQLSGFLAAGKISSVETGNQDAVRAKFLSIFGEILARHQYEHRGDIYQENATTFVLVNQDMDLALVQELARKARDLGLRLKLM